MKRLNVTGRIEEMKRRKIIIGEIGITILFALLSLCKIKNLTVPTIDHIEFEYNFEEKDLPIAIWLNDVFQGGWSESKVEDNGRVVQKIEVGNYDTYSNMIFTISYNGNSGKAFRLYSIKFTIDGETIITFSGNDLAAILTDTQSKNEYSSIVNESGLTLESGDNVLWYQVDSDGIKKINNGYLDWKADNISQMQKQIIVHMTQWGILVGTSVFWIIIFGKSIWSMFIKALQDTFIPKKYNKNHYEWIYLVRGMAIIAVVVCHQIMFLHTAEWIQMISLYSVTTFVFCMGITKWLSISSFLAEGRKSWIGYIVKSLKGILSVYFIATCCYLAVEKKFGFWNVLQAMLTFSGSRPLYFVKIVVLFSIYAPIVFLILKHIEKRQDIKISLEVAVLATVFIIGYVSIDNLDIFGGSYLFIYVAGMIFCMNGFPKVNWLTWGGSLFLLGIGGLSIYKFYLESMVAVQQPAKIGGGYRCSCAPTICKSS